MFIIYNKMKALLWLNKKEKPQKKFKYINNTYNMEKISYPSFWYTNFREAHPTVIPSTN